MDLDYIDSELVISEIRKFPCLYETTKGERKDKGEKDDAWSSVIKSIAEDKWANMSNSERRKFKKATQKRWKSLKDSFTRALKTRHSRERSSRPIKPYVYYKQMSFLFPFEQFRSLSEQLPETCPSKEDDSLNVSDSEVSESSEIKKKAKLQYANNESTKSARKKKRLISSKKMGSKRSARLRESLLSLEEQPTQPVQKKQRESSPVSESVQPARSALIKSDRKSEGPILNTGVNKPVVVDPDEMFLLALLPEFKKVKPCDRMDVQIHFLKILKSYTSDAPKCSFTSPQKPQEAFQERPQYLSSTTEYEFLDEATEESEDELTVESNSVISDETENDFRVNTDNNFTDELDLQFQERKPQVIRKYLKRQPTVHQKPVPITGNFNI